MSIRLVKLFTCYIAKQMAKKNPHAVALGKLGAEKRSQVLTPEEKKEIAKKGGTVGGPARAKKLTQARRTEIARKAGKAGAAARWGRNQNRPRPVE
jgi:hypothetical protein